MFLAESRILRATVEDTPRAAWQTAEVVWGVATFAYACLAIREYAADNIGNALVFTGSAIVSGVTTVVFDRLRALRDEVAAEHS